MRREKNAGAFTGEIKVKRMCVFLCGVLAAALMTGCGSTVPDLTQEETDLISEYAVGVLLKYDKYHSGRLVDTEGYETAGEDTAETASEETPEEEVTEKERVSAEETADAEPEEAEAAASTIEGFYGIQDFAFQYTGYDLTQSYPSGDEENAYFSMDATEGMQLLVLHFTAANISGSDQILNMMGCGARFRVSVNGEPGESALTTMLLDDMQTYNDTVPAGGSAELVSIVEVPQSISVETIDFTLRGSDGNATIKLQ